jgi:hypothetical protein
MEKSLWILGYIMSSRDRQQSFFRLSFSNSMERANLFQNRETINLEKTKLFH